MKIFTIVVDLGIILLYFRDMKRRTLRTVTGAEIKLGNLAGYFLDWVVESGNDWIAEIKIIGHPVVKRARVYVSENPGVETLMRLAHERRELRIL